MTSTSLDRARDGVCRLPHLVAENGLHCLERLLPVPILAGVRLVEMPQLAGWVNDHLTRPLATLLGHDFQPVRAILFDKRASSNWTLGWHQDRTVAVRERRDADGYGIWSVKQGILHVEPPFGVIEAMSTIRLHLDPVSEANGPLMVALGSHRLGAIRDREAAVRALELPILHCLAERGDCWLYSTPILHASGPVRPGVTGRRRVLQIDYSCDPLPGGIEWRGLGGAPRLSESRPSTKPAP